MLHLMSLRQLAETVLSHGARRCESGALPGSDAALEACTMTIVASVPLRAVLAASSAVSIASKVAVSSVVAAVGLCTDDDAKCG